MKYFSKIIIPFSVSLLIFIGCEKNKREIVEHNEPPAINNNNPLNSVPLRDKKITKQENIDEKTAEEILAVIYENLDATRSKDKERVLATIHKDSPQRKSTIEGMDFVFSNFDLEYVLEKVEVVEIKGDEAKVYYMQTTRALKGTGFANMRAVGIHYMKKSGNSWKIFKTESMGTEPIP